MKKHQIMKRALACLMVVLMTVTAVPLSGFVGLELPDLSSTKARAATEGYLEYEVEDGEATITGHTSSISGDLVIPDTLGVYPVTRIGSWAFYRCTGLTSVTIPNSVTFIDGYAFWGCTGLTSVTIGNSVTDIGEGAFLGCTGLTSVTIPDSVTYLGFEAFAGCTGLKSVTIGNGVEIISGYFSAVDGSYWGVFYDCPLTTIKIGKSVKFIQNDAFSGIKDIPEVYYAGSKADWEKISIHKSNEMLLKANMHYNVDITHTHSYTSKITKATTTKDGKIVIACTVCGNISKTTPIYKASSVKLSKTSFAYTGKVQTPTVTVKDSKGNTLKSGKDYTVKYDSGRKNIGKYSVTVTFKGNYTGKETLFFNIILDKTSKLTATQTTSSVKATWKAVTGADGYKVTLYSAKNKAIKTVYTTKTTASFTKLSKGTTYKVRVTAYKTVDGKKVSSSVYTQLTTATKPGTPTLKVTAGTGKATLAWNKQTGATGYVVYMATSKNGKYTKIATLKGNTKVSFTKTGLTKGKTYYFKVASYETVGGKTVYGSFSSVKYAKIK